MIFRKYLQLGHFCEKNVNCWHAKLKLKTLHYSLFLGNFLIFSEQMFFKSSLNRFFFYSRSYYMVIKRLLHGHQEIITWSSRSHYMVIKKLLHGHQEVITWSSRSHYMVISVCYFLILFNCRGLAFC